MLDFILSQSFSCDLVLEVHSEVEVAEEKDTIVRHCPRESSSFAESFLHYVPDLFGALGYLPAA